MVGVVFASMVFTLIIIDRNTFFKFASPARSWRSMPIGRPPPSSPSMSNNSNNRALCIPDHLVQLLTSHHFHLHHRHVLPVLHCSLAQPPNPSAPCHTLPTYVWLAVLAVSKVSPINLCPLPPLSHVFNVVNSIMATAFCPILSFTQGIFIIGNAYHANFVIKLTNKISFDVIHVITAFTHLVYPHLPFYPRISFYALSVQEDRTTQQRHVVVGWCGSSCTGYLHRLPYIR